MSFRAIEIKLIVAKERNERDCRNAFVAVDKWLRFGDSVGKNGRLQIDSSGLIVRVLHWTIESRYESFVISQMIFCLSVGDVEDVGIEADHVFKFEVKDAVG